MEEIGIGRRRFARIVHDAAKGYGWIVGTTRKNRRSEYDLLTAFLKPNSKKIDVNDFPQRFETSLEALAGVQETLSLVLHPSKRMVVNVPVAPLERYEQMGLPFPLRLVIDMGPNKRKRSHIKVAGIYLKKYDRLDDVIARFLEKFHPRYLSNDVKESYAAYFLHQGFHSDATVIRNLWFYRYELPRRKESRRTGLPIAEIDALYHYPRDRRIVLTEVKSFEEPGQVRSTLGSKGSRKGKLNRYKTVVEILEKQGYEVIPAIAIVLHPKREQFVEDMWRELRSIALKEEYEKLLAYFLIPEDPRRPRVYTYEL